MDIEEVSRRAAERWSGALDLLAKQEQEDRRRGTEEAERYMYPAPMCKD